MRSLAQVAAICFCGAALGLVLNWASARPANLLRAVFPASSSGVGVCSASPEAQHETHGHKVMPQAEAVAACNSCSVAFVDARGAAAYAQGHIVGAIHLPPAGHPNESHLMEKLRSYATVVVYDSGGGCGLAEGVADRLAVEKFKDVRILEGSWSAWQAVGGPALSGACQACDSQNHSEGHAP